MKDVGSNPTLATVKLKRMMKINKIGKEGLSLIKKWEGCKLKAYVCSAGVNTIGFGNTFYQDGTKVKLGDVITQFQADKLLLDTLVRFEQYVDSMTTDSVNQYQFDALVSFCYNVGSTNLKKSTLLKMININPNDPKIGEEFKKWNRAGGRILKGLTNRRSEEIALYFKK